MEQSITKEPVEKPTDNQIVPILPLKGTVVFPYVVTPLMIHEPEYVRLIDEALMRGSRIGLFLQKNPKQEDPQPDDLYEIGTGGNILKMLRFPDGTVRFLIQGLSRIRVKRFDTTEPFLTAEIEELEEVTDDPVKMEALQRNLMQQVDNLVDLAPYLTEEFHVEALNQDSVSKQVDFIASSLNITLEQKQKVLAETHVFRRMEFLYQAISKEIEVLELSQKIQAEAANELGKSQRDYILREQLKAIKRELGDGDGKEELEEFEDQIVQAQMPETAEKAAFKELDRLRHMQPSSAEYTVARTYLDWMCTLPWSLSTTDILDLKKARKVLDEDHYDLEKVKDRILEHLAVRKLKSDIKGPILCFVGPPGVGKTSLGRSIARAMGRKFARVALGGMRDEAEIRGHRRTYIGSMPGRIIQNIRRCGSNNPVIMLDEIDKLGSDFRGDPASALLEVLDPEQNNSFSDYYLDLPFDLSKVFFITTANWLEPIPPVLRDRMEMIPLPGYTDMEKLRIAKKHLIPRQIENHGLTKSQFKLADSAVKLLIDGYTREAGLRNLEREIASVARKIARRVVSGNRKKGTVQAKDITRLLGPAKFTRETLNRHKRVGVVPGLAYTAYGGELLYVEATAMPGKGNLMLTGHLGTVMKESAHAALSFIRSNAKDLKIDPNALSKQDFHIHVPAGATPKDGPSAGITMA
ncbi:MAG: endopeptidase La, partial [candidate division Zixibacteria bacterium]